MAEITVESGPGWTGDYRSAVLRAKPDDVIVVRSATVAVLARARAATLGLERTIVVRARGEERVGRRD